MTQRMYLLFSLLFLFSCQPPVSKAPSDQLINGPIGEKLDSTLTPYIRQLLEDTDNSAAVAIGITKGKEIIYARTFGYANVDDHIPADLNTLFHIASVSKPFAAVATVKLIQDGQLNLEDRLVDHIPEFQMQGDGYEKITIEHLLTHTSGIPRHVSVDDWLHPSYGPSALEENLEDAKKFELDFDPGSEFSYSNSAFDILGLLIQRVSGMPYTEYVEKNVLQAGGMVHSTFDKPEELPANWALPYSYGLTTQLWTPYPFSGKCTPSSGLQTTLMDMCQWGLLHVGKGTYKDHQILDSAHFDLLTTAHYDTPWGDKIGLSWFLQSYLDRPVWMHLGNDTGFETSQYIYPEDEVSITVMANRDFARTGRMVLAAAEILFGEKPKDYTVSAKYPFAKAMRSSGIASAKEEWTRLSADTTDIYFVDNDDLLTTGAVLENGKFWQETAPVLTYYLEKNDQSTYAWRLLGNAKLNLGDTTAAVACYQQALQINPTYEKAQKNLAELGIKD